MLLGESLPLTGSQLGPRGTLDTALGRCMSSQQEYSDASGTQSYLSPLSGPNRDEKEMNIS